MGEGINGRRKQHYIRGWTARGTISGRGMDEVEPSWRREKRKKKMSGKKLCLCESAALREDAAARAARRVAMHKVSDPLTLSRFRSAKSVASQASHQVPALKHHCRVAPHCLQSSGSALTLRCPAPPLFYEQ